jgi:hypothetical protein
VDVTAAPNGVVRKEGEPVKAARRKAKAAAAELRAEVQSKSEPVQPQAEPVAHLPSAGKMEPGEGVLELRRRAKTADATVIWTVNMRKAWSFVRLVRQNEDGGEVAFTVPRSWVSIFGNGPTVQVWSSTLGIEHFVGEKLDAQEAEVRRQAAARRSPLAPSNRSRAFVDWFNGFRLAPVN